VLAFPCNQFAGQEPGNAEEIANFCSLTYDVSFPIFAKIDVNGGDADPLWNWLKSEKGGLLGIDSIKWNFTKFLIARDGQVVSRHAPTVKPSTLRAEIERLLG
jgi:glutathione peroxidase